MDEDTDNTLGVMQPDGTVIYGNPRPEHDDLVNNWNALNDKTDVDTSVKYDPNRMTELEYTPLPDLAPEPLTQAKIIQSLSRFDLGNRDDITPSGMQDLKMLGQMYLENKTPEPLRVGKSYYDGSGMFGRGKGTDDPFVLGKMIQDQLKKPTNVMLHQEDLDKWNTFISTIKEDTPENRMQIAQFQAYMLRQNAIKSGKFKNILTNPNEQQQSRLSTTSPETPFAFNDKKFTPPEPMEQITKYDSDEFKKLFDTPEGRSKIDSEFGKYINAGYKNDTTNNILTSQMTKYGLAFVRDYMDNEGESTKKFDIEHRYRALSMNDQKMVSTYMQLNRPVEDTGILNTLNEAVNDGLVRGTWKMFDDSAKYITRGIASTYKTDEQMEFFDKAIELERAVGRLERPNYDETSWRDNEGFWDTTKGLIHSGIVGTGKSLPFMAFASSVYTMPVAIMGRTEENYEEFKKAGASRFDSALFGTVSASIEMALEKVQIGIIDDAFKSAGAGSLVGKLANLSGLSGATSLASNKIPRTAFVKAMKSNIKKAINTRIGKATTIGLGTFAKTKTGKAVSGVTKFGAKLGSHMVDEIGIEGTQGATHELLKNISHDDTRNIASKVWKAFKDNALEAIPTAGLMIGAGHFAGKLAGHHRQAELKEQLESFGMDVEQWIPVEMVLNNMYGTSSIELSKGQIEAINKEHNKLDETDDTVSLQKATNMVMIDSIFGEGKREIVQGITKDIGYTSKDWRSLDHILINEYDTSISNISMEVYTKALVNANERIGEIQKGGIVTNKQIFTQELVDAIEDSNTQEQTQMLDDAGVDTQAKAETLQADVEDIVNHTKQVREDNAELGSTMQDVMDLIYDNTESDAHAEAITNDNAFMESVENAIIDGDEDTLVNLVTDRLTGKVQNTTDTVKQDDVNAPKDDLMEDFDDVMANIMADSETDVNVDKSKSLAESLSEKGNDEFKKALATINEYKGGKLSSGIDPGLLTPAIKISYRVLTGVSYKMASLGVTGYDAFKKIATDILKSDEYNITLDENQMQQFYRRKKIHDEVYKGETPAELKSRNDSISKVDKKVLETVDRIGESEVRSKKIADIIKEKLRNPAEPKPKRVFANPPLYNFSHLKQDGIIHLNDIKQVVDVVDDFHDIKGKDDIDSLEKRWVSTIATLKAITRTNLLYSNVVKADRDTMLQQFDDSKHSITADDYQHLMDIFTGINIPLIDGTSTGAYDSARNTLHDRIDTHITDYDTGIVDTVKDLLNKTSDDIDATITGIRSEIQTIMRKDTRSKADRSKLIELEYKSDILDMFSRRNNGDVIDLNRASDVRYINSRIKTRMDAIKRKRSRAVDTNNGLGHTLRTALLNGVTGKKNLKRKNKQKDAGMISLLANSVLSYDDRIEVLGRYSTGQVRSKFDAFKARYWTDINRAEQNRLKLINESSERFDESWDSSKAKDLDILHLETIGEIPTHIDGKVNTLGIDNVTNEFSEDGNTNMSMGQLMMIYNLGQQAYGVDGMTQNDTARTQFETLFPDAKEKFAKLHEIITGDPVAINLYNTIQASMAELANKLEVSDANPNGHPDIQVVNVNGVYDLTQFINQDMTSGIHSLKFKQYSNKTARLDRTVSLFDAYQSKVDMLVSYYTHYDMSKMYTDILTDTDVARAIKDQDGNEVYRRLLEHTRAVVDRKDMGLYTDKTANAFRKLATGLIMIFNAGSGIKQGASIFTNMLVQTKVNGELLKQLTKNERDQIVSEIKSHDAMFREFRMSRGHNESTRAIMKDNDSKLNAFLKSGSWFNRWMDGKTIKYVNSANYSIKKALTKYQEEFDLVKNDKVKRQAFIDKITEDARVNDWANKESTQQSSSAKDMSIAQLEGGTFYKLFTMFQSAQRQFLSKESAAFSTYLANRNSANLKNLARVLTINHIVTPIMWTTLSTLISAMKGEPTDPDKVAKDFVINAIIGPLGGSMYYSLVGAPLVATIAGDRVYSGKAWDKPATVARAGIKTVKNHDMDSVINLGKQINPLLRDLINSSTNWSDNGTILGVKAPKNMRRAKRRKLRLAKRHRREWFGDDNEDQSE